MHDYRITPEFVLSNPSPENIEMDQVTVVFDDSTTAIYSAETFTIPAPSVPTWYYVTVDSSTRVATCDISGELVGVPGHVYVGAIQAIPAGRSINAVVGGWPPPTTWMVGD